MKANLHFHSFFSDGEDSPEELVKRASNHGFEILALTDHDTFQGVERFMLACKQLGIKGIAASEVDCEESFSVRRNPFHFSKEILAYYPEIKNICNTGLFSKLEQTRQEREALVRFFLNRLVPYLPLSWESFLQSKLGNHYSENMDIKVSINKSDLFSYLKNQGFFLPELFHNLPGMRDQKIPEDPVKMYRFFKESVFSALMNELPQVNKPGLFEIVKFIREDGGYPVLPHPGHLYKDSGEVLLSRKEEFEALLEMLRDSGLWGVELYYYSRAKSETEFINREVKRSCERLNLKTTFGSDYHGNSRESCVFEGFFGDFEGF